MISLYLFCQNPNFWVDWNDFWVAENTLQKLWCFVCKWRELWAYTSHSLRAESYDYSQRQLIRSRIWVVLICTCLSLSFPLMFLFIVFFVVTNVWICYNKENNMKGNDKENHNWNDKDKQVQMDATFKRNLIDCCRLKSGA